MAGQWWYALDAEDRVVDVSDGWDAFALENGSPGAVRDAVVGRPFYGFIAGSQTRSLLQMIFDRVRTLEQPIELPFRCDAPSVRRFMSFTAEVEAGGGLRVHTRILGTGARDALPYLEPGGASGRPAVRVCSWCNRIAVPDGRWLEAETAAEQLGLLLAPLPPITHGICPRCQRGVMESMDRPDAA